MSKRGSNVFRGYPFYLSFAAQDSSLTVPLNDFYTRALSILMDDRGSGRVGARQIQAQHPSPKLQA